MPPPDPIHTGQECSTPPTVTPSEVSKLLASIPSKSSNLDYIPTSILKTCSSIFSPLIARLANLSFDQGQFPSDFKIAQITPLLKKPNLDPTNPANYRPISVYTFLSNSGLRFGYDECLALLGVFFVNEVLSFYPDFSLFLYWWLIVFIPFSISFLWLWFV